MKSWTHWSSAVADSVVYGTLGLDESWTMKAYKTTGGYEAWERIVKEGVTRDEIIDEMKKVVPIWKKPVAQP